MRYQHIFFLFTLNLIGLFTKAQSDSLFFRLRQAIGNHEREKAHLYFDEIFQKEKKEHFRPGDLLQIFDFSHELVRMGYAEDVLAKLKIFNPGNSGFPAISEDLFGKYFIEVAYAFYNNNQLQQADSILQENVKIAKSGHPISNLDVAYSMNMLGLIHRRFGETDSALDFFKQALKIRKEELGPMNPQVGSVLNNIGLVYKSRGDFDEAISYFEQAVEIKSKSGDPSVYLNYLNIGEVKTLLGNYSGALEFYKKAENILQEINAPSQLADLYINIGAAYNLLKANLESYQYFQRALVLYTNIYGVDSEKSGLVYQNLANVYEELGDYENELKSTQQAIKILENIYGQNALEVAPLYNNLGLVYKNQNRSDLALRYLQQAEKIYAENDLEDTEKYLNTLGNIAEIYSSLGKFESAINVYNNSVQKLDALFNGRHPLLANAFNNLAEIYLKKADFVNAKKMLVHAIESNSSENKNAESIYENCLDPSILFKSYLLAGNLSAKTEKKNEAGFRKTMSNFHLADSILSVQRNFLFDKNDKINLAQNAKRLTEAILNLLVLESGELKTRNLNLAFKSIEKSKNLVLLNSIAERNEKRYAGIPDSVLTKEELMLGRINYLTHQLELEKDSISKQNLQGQLFQKKEEYKLLVQTLEKNYPEYYSLRNRNAIPDIEAVRQKLNNKTVVLSYFVSENAVFRMLISKKECVLDKVPVSGFEDLLTGMRKGITLKLNEIYLEKASRLYSLLIPPSVLGYEKLLIVPDGGLTVLPFEALLTKSVSIDTNSEQWPFLLKKAEISYSPSLSIWLTLNSEKKEVIQQKSFLAFAPVFSDEVHSEISESKIPQLNIENYDSKLNEMWLAPLLSSEQEIKGIDSLFREHNLVSKIYSNSDATEANFESRELQDYSFIHIATHGFVAKNNPELSGLFFAPDLSGLSDNILYTGEIYNLKFKADLITLSACETGLGRIAEGEGMLGFSRAFLYSGAKNLLLSLWKVDDSSTSQLMKNMYEEIIKDHASISQALYSSKIKLIESGKYSHPYYWAAFILTGS